MNPTVKKALLFFVGAAAITKEKANKVVAELKKENALDPEQGKQVFTEVVQKGTEKAGQIADTVKVEVKKIVNEAKPKSSGTAEAPLQNATEAFAQCCCGKDKQGHQCGEGECDCGGDKCDHQNCECKQNESTETPEMAQVVTHTEFKKEENN